MDVLFLARLQFAITIMFHYLFPPLTIGLSALMVLAEGLHLKTGDPRYLSIARFWTKLFAVNFALGVATGIVNQFQFGTNWATYSRFVGDVFGTALASEGIFAFFLETGFMGVVVFGWDRVSPRLHFFSTCMVMFGGLFSSIWIVIANSWMQTPAGCTIVTEAGRPRAQVTDFWAMVFNPSMLIRLMHVWLASFILGAFFVLAIAAWYVIRERFLPVAHKMISLSLGFTCICCSLIMISGDSSAREVAQYQPVKLAAFEGHFDTGTGAAPLYLIGMPDQATRKMHMGIYIPGMLTFLVYHNFDTPVMGLDHADPNDWPPVLPCFASFHIMVGLGTYMLGIAWLGMFFLRRGTLFTKKWMMVGFMLGVVSAYLCNEAGWVAAEVGRQPWVVQGMLRTRQASSDSVPGGEVLASILLFSFIYLLLFLLWVYGMKRKIEDGPHDPEAPPPPTDLNKGIVSSVSQRIRRKSGQVLGEVGVDLHTFWFVMLGLMLSAYAMLDGFDLGVGVIYMVARTNRERQLFLGAIGPLWDGNEVWLVCFGGAFFGAFPEAYATTFSGFYLPFVALLVALLMRAVASEFRDLETWTYWRSFWDCSFFLACLATCFIFGLMVADALRGLPIEANREFVGSLADLGGTFPCMVGLECIALFGLHGALYLHLRLGDVLRPRLARTSWVLLGCFLALHMFVSTRVLILHPPIEASLLHMGITRAALTVNLLSLAGLVWFLAHGRPLLAFLCSASNIVSLNTLFGATLYPRLLVSSINPAHSLTIYNSASTVGTLKLMSWVALAGTPFAVGYTFLLFWVFRGQVRVHEDP